MPESVSAPTILTTIPQDFIVEALGGPTQPTALLDRFPESLYSKSPDSHLVRFVFALLGPVGVGRIKASYLQARLQLEELGLELFDLDAFFGNPLAFGRILEEDYDDDLDGLLDTEAQERIRARDARYRSRALDFVGGVRLGNSPGGMRLVARAGLGHDVEIVENYQFLFDVHSDDPKGFRYFGQTGSTEEMIVLPRQTVSRSSVQTIAVYGSPTGGYLALTFNGRSSDAPGFTTIPYNAPATGDWVDADPGYVETLPDGRTVSGRRLVQPGVQDVLEAHPDIGYGNVRVTGGPGPDQPWVVTFIGNLSGRDVPAIGFQGDPNQTLTGGDPLRTATVSVTVGGLDASDEVVDLGPREQYHLQQALDRIRAVTTIPTVASATGKRATVMPNSVYATSEFIEVVRYVTGTPAVQWPPIDSLRWIERSVEHEAPRGWGDARQHYQGFHSIAGVTAYTEASLPSDFFSTGTLEPGLRSEHTGAFNPAQRALYPVLDNADPDLRFTADRAAADYPEQPLVTGLDPTGQVALIQGVYPAEYASLPGVAPVKYRDEQFWSSFERTDGTEYLEVDLGTLQAVNFIAFETLRKPISVEIGYDYLDQAPRRGFIPVIPDDRTNFPDRVGYSAAPGWTYLEFHFADVTGGPVFTRYLRIALTRNVNQLQPFLYDLRRGVQEPWSVEVRNLRIGRNVSN